MNDINSANLSYFETDQIKLSVQLWKTIKHAHGVEFDILKFTQSWSYADRVLAEAMTAPDQTVSDCALGIMQLRTLFAQKYPERARKLGARISNEGPARTVAEASTQAQKSTDGAPKEPDPHNRRYLKGLR